MSKSKYPQLGAGAINYLKGNQYELRALPHPDEEWKWTDINLRNGLSESLQRRGIIRKVDLGNASEPITYQTERAAYEMLQELLQESENAMLPCGHGGFVNDREIDGLRCKRCDEIWSKKTVQEWNTP